MKSQRFAYHATSKPTLAKIAVEGLKPQRHEAYEKPIIWFADDSLGASFFGEVVLRFPFPSDATFDDDPRGFGQYVTFRSVPSSTIDVWDSDDGWIALPLFLH